MKTVVITLKHRTDRQEKIIAELAKWKIDFTFHYATTSDTLEGRAKSNQTAHLTILEKNNSHPLK